jgi:hypothetical protein
VSVVSKTVCSLLLDDDHRAARGRGARLAEADRDGLDDLAVLLDGHLLGLVRHRHDERAADLDVDGQVGLAVPAVAQRHAGQRTL